MKPSPKPQLEKRKDTIEYKEGDPYIIITMSKEADKQAQGKQGRKELLPKGCCCIGGVNCGLCPVHSLGISQEPEPNSDLLPFKHGEENTHYACKEMMEKLGDKVVCCACNGHQCQEPEPKQEWKEVIDGVFLHGRETPELSYNLPDGQYTVAQAIELIDQELTQAKEEGRRETVEEIKHLYYNCEDGNGFHADEFWEGLDHLQERNK